MGLVIGVVNSHLERAGGTFSPVTTGHGRVGAYLSVVDNTTGDHLERALASPYFSPGFVARPARCRASPAAADTW